MLQSHRFMFVGQGTGGSLNTQLTALVFSQRAAMPYLHIRSASPCAVFRTVAAHLIH